MRSKEKAPLKEIEKIRTMITKMKNTVLTMIMTMRTRMMRTMKRM